MSLLYFSSFAGGGREGGGRVVTNYQVGTG